MSDSNGTLERPRSALETAGKVGGVSGWSAWKHGAGWKWCVWDAGNAAGGLADDRHAAIRDAQAALEELVARRKGWPHDAA